MDAELRWTTEADATALAAVQAAAWRFAYLGVIPGLALQKRIAAHGPNWWRRLHRQGGRALALEHGGALAGYARLGASRSAPEAGEIFELYLEPAHAGLGFGRQIFDEARRRLARSGKRRLIVWALAENRAAQRFYRRLGGEECATGPVWVCGERLEQIAFAWR